jgi:hypothetical protein
MEGQMTLNDEDYINSLGGTVMPDKKWKDVSPDSETWKPEKGDSIEGVYAGSRMTETKFGQKTIYSVEKADHTITGVWESANITKFFNSISVGSEIKITFLGREQNKNGQPVNKFKFQVAE